MRVDCRKNGTKVYILTKVAREKERISA
jgi:hypothetical protein